jgi:hypothetical protein
MAKAHPPDELAKRAFYITMAGVITWIVVAFVFVIRVV